MTHPNSDLDNAELKATVSHAELERARTNETVLDADAAGFTDLGLEISEEENKALYSKINKRVLPILCLAYLCQALDKSTTGTASIMGWLTDINAKGNDYAMTSTLLWCGIIVGEPIANQLVRKLPIAKLLGGAMVVWSVLLYGMAFSMSVPPVFAIRFLLGLFESVVGPCLLSLMVQWYLTAEQPLISAIWQSMLGLNTVIGGLYGYGFVKVTDSTLKGWQYLNIMVATVSLVSSIVVLLFLPDSPTNARWAMQEEKTKFVERVRSNNQGLKQKHFKKEQLWEALTDQYTYILFFMPVVNTLVVGGIGTFAPILINQSFGFAVDISQLLNIPLGVVGILLYFLMAFLIRKTNNTLLCMAAITIPNIVGTVVLLTVTPSDKTRGGLLVAFYCMQCFQACNPAVFLMLSRNSAGQTKKSVTYAVTYIGWAGGNAIAPQLFQSKWHPRYFTSLYIHLGLYGVWIILCLYTRWMLKRRNRLRDEAQAGKRIIHEHAFEDLTDLQNPDFRYCI